MNSTQNLLKDDPWIELMLRHKLKERLRLARERRKTQTEKIIEKMNGDGYTSKFSAYRSGEQIVLEPLHVHNKTTRQGSTQPTLTHREQLEEVSDKTKFPARKFSQEKQVTDQPKSMKEEQYDHIYNSPLHDVLQSTSKIQAESKINAIAYLRTERNCKSNSKSLSTFNKIKTTNPVKGVQNTPKWSKEMNRKKAIKHRKDINFPRLKPISSKQLKEVKKMDKNLQPEKEIRNELTTMTDIHSTLHMLRKHFIEEGKKQMELLETIREIRGICAHQFYQE